MIKLKARFVNLIIIIALISLAQQLNAQVKTTHTTTQTKPKTSTQVKANPNAPLKTKSGLTYKVFPGNGVEKIAPGEFVKFQLRYTVEPEDSVLHSSFINIPDYSAVDTSAKVKYSFMEVMPKLKVGDSAEINVSVDTLVKRKMLPAYNPVLQKGGVIKCQIKLLNSFKSDSAVEADYDNEITLEKDREVKTIQDYVTQQNIKTEQTKNGVFISIENVGDDSIKADSGKIASIKYKGYLMNGSVFDTNMDSSKGHTDPISVMIGQHKVIPGWEEALPYFGKGGKGKIIIPAMLGYGPQPMGTDIPAYSNLVFDIEIVDVKASNTAPLDK